MSLQFFNISYAVALCCVLLAWKPWQTCAYVEPLNVCPDIYYRTISLLKHPLDASYFSDIKSWTSSETSDYVQHEIIRRAAVSLSFVVIGIVALEIFVLWRIQRCCCRKFGKCTESRPFMEVVKGPLIWSFKIAALLLIVGVIVASAIGIYLAKPNTSDSIITALTAIVDYGRNKLLADMQNVIVQVNAILPITTQLDQAAVGAPPQQANNITACAAAVRTGVNSIVNSYSGSITDASQVLNDMGDLQDHVQSITTKADGIAYKVTVSFLAAAILLVLLLLLFVILHNPLGIALMVGLGLALVVLSYTAATLLAAGLIGGTDICTNMESIIEVVAPSKFTPLLSYYFSASTPTDSEETLLAQANIIDVSNLQSQISTGINGSTATLQALAADPSMPSSNSAAINATIINLNSQVSSITNAIGGTVGDIGYGVVGDAAYTPAHALYVDFKTAACCTFPNQVAKQWAVLSALGWVLLAACIAAMLVLARLDLLPQAGDCCTPSFLTAHHFIALDEEATARLKMLQDSLVQPLQPTMQAPPPQPAPQINTTHHYYAAPPPTMELPGQVPEVTELGSPRLDWKRRLENILSEPSHLDIPEIIIPEIRVPVPRVDGASFETPAWESVHFNDPQPLRDASRDRADQHTPDRA